MYRYNYITRTVDEFIIKIRDDGELLLITTRRCYYTNLNMLFWFYRRILLGGVGWH